MAEKYYRGTIRKHLPVTASTGTPGIEFEIDIDQVQHAGGYVASTPMARRVSIWFPTGGDHSYSLKKLRHAGWKGGGLNELDLCGNTAELIGKEEEYQGRIVEKFELAFPRKESQVSESAALTIDAILQSAPIDTSPQPAAPSSVARVEASQAASEIDQIAQTEFADDQEIPF